MKHEQMVYNLFKKGETLTPAYCELLHAALGMAGEVGEILDTVKKCVFYKQPLDEVNLVEELGDLEFYMEAFRQVTRIFREVTILGNMEKLGVRYPGFKYTDQAAHERADKL